MRVYPGQSGWRVLGGLLLAVAFVVAPAAAVHAGGGVTLPEPSMPADTSSPDVLTTPSPTPSATTPPPVVEPTAPASNPADTPPSPSPSPPPSLPPPESASPTAIPSPTAPPPSVPEDAADVSAAANRFPLWALIAAVVGIVVVVASTLAALRIRKARVPRHPSAQAASFEPAAPPDTDPWATLSAQEREAFERTAEEFGWHNP